MGRKNLSFYTLHESSFEKEKFTRALGRSTIDAILTSLRFEKAVRFKLQRL